MFGYIMINKEALSDEEQRRFRSYYCGLCRSLGKRHGVSGRFTLSHDMAFLAVVLTSLYEPETVYGTQRCAAHPKQRHEYAQNRFIDYAADMTIALAYHKALDNWADDKNLAALSEARLTKSRYLRVKALYPDKTAVIERQLNLLSETEKTGLMQVDPPANAFGSLLGELFAYQDDMWAETLRQMGAGLGRFIYLMDAYEDLPADRRKERFNPLLASADEPDFEQKCKDYLTLLIAECTNAFEKLPLVDNLSIMRNILYSGVWTRYQYIRKKRGVAD